MTLFLRRLLSTFLTLALACCRPSSTSSADSSAVLAASEQYRQAWIAGDTAAALGRLSTDIRILIPSVADINGVEAARRLFLDEMASFRVPAFTMNHQDLIVSGDHAIDIGTYEETQQPEAGGAPLHWRGRFMTIWRRENGEWRITRYMLNELPRVESRSK